MGGREAAGDKIQWTRLEQPWFDRIVEALLLRKFRGIADVEAVDGRGGDGGIDVSVTYPDGHLAIYQLKYYPEGMSGGHKPRRTEVKNSFKQAVKKHEPNEWVLVAPRNYTNPEISFLRGLSNATPDGKRSPTIKWVGRGDLDQMLIDFPEVDRWVSLDHVRRTREIFEWEKTAFCDSPASDLARRVKNLGEVVDSTDPDWTWDFARNFGLSTQTLRPQHDNAADRSPISINFSTAFDTDSPDERALQRSIEFGSPARIEIPKDALTMFEVSGPAIVRGLPDPDLLVITSLPVDNIPAVGMLMEIRFLDGGELAATEEGTVTKVYRGTRGISSVMSFCRDRLTVTAQIPYETSPGPTTLEVEFKLQGLSPRAVSDLLDTAFLLRTSKEVELHIDGRPLARYARSTAECNEGERDSTELFMIHRFAEDLAFVLAHTRQNMTFPSSFTVNDRVHARVARLLIEGYIVASPLARGIHASLADGTSLTPELRATLTRRLDARWPAGPYSAPIVGRTFNLGQSLTLHPETWIENGAAALEALEHGESSTDRLVVRPGDDPYFFVYLPEANPGGHSGRWFAKWNLDGVEEPWLDRPWLEFEDPETE